MRKLTPAEIAIATAKRMAAIAARKASGGMTVKQQRAAAKAAKMGTSYVPPTSSSSTSTSSSYVPPKTYAPPPPPKPAGPAFSRRGGYTQPAPTYRGVKLVALSAIEDAFVLKCKEQGVNQELRDAYAKYQKLKALALGQTNNSATQNEADTALRMAILHLVKLAF